MVGLGKYILPLWAQTHSRGVPGPALLAEAWKCEAPGGGGGVPLPQETKAQVQREQHCQGECCHLAQPGRQQSGRGCPAVPQTPPPQGI